MKTYYYVDSETSKVKKIEKYDNFQNNGGFYFETPEKAIEDYNYYKNIAMPELEEIKNKLDALQESLNFDISYAMYGDTYGIYEDYLYISVRKSKYYFRLKI